MYYFGELILENKFCGWKVVYSNKRGVLIAEFPLLAVNSYIFVEQDS